MASIRISSLTSLDFRLWMTPIALYIMTLLIGSGLPIVTSLLRIILG